MNRIFSDRPASIFSVMSALATEHQAVNLGQGFPDSQGPEDVRAKAAEAVLHGYNQYPPSAGLPELRQSIARHYARFQGLELDWSKQVLVTSGATEALASSIFGLVSRGDEVVLLEPAYDAYTPLIEAAGGVMRSVRLAPPRWTITAEALEAATTDRTRMVILNNPLNPAARVYAPEELQVLADWCERHDLIALSDEVWEHLTFDGLGHTPILAVPGMAERSVKIGSAGKIFSMTGWKVGWACGPERLISAIAKAHQFITFTTPPNLQSAVAFGLDKDAAYFGEMRSGYARSRDRMASALQAEGYAVLPSEGTYFLNIDLAASGLNLDDEAFCLKAVKQAGVAAIPVSSFYASDPVRSVVRLCFAKKDETIDAGVERLGKARRL
jgi:aspartate/methionine/tyrosine aminotransferase